MAKQPLGRSGSADRLAQLVEVGDGPVERRAPQRSCSSERIAFCSASLKVRPIAITSPTDFICVVSVGSASGNFSNAQRGILTTQ